MLAGTSPEEGRRLNVAGLKQTRFLKQSCCFAQSVYNGWFTGSEQFRWSTRYICMGFLCGTHSSAVNSLN